MGLGEAEASQDEVEEDQDQVEGLEDVLLLHPLGLLGDDLADLHTDNKDGPNYKQSYNITPGYFRF